MSTRIRHPFLTVDTDLARGIKPRPAHPHHGPVGSSLNRSQGRDGMTSGYRTPDNDPFGLKFD
jgi:hypothetical protein